MGDQRIELTGITFTGGYIIYFKYIADDPDVGWLFGISPEGIGAIGMLLNFAVTIAVSRCTTAPPQSVRDLVARIRQPE